MLDRLWFRLLLGMTLVLAVAVGAVAALTNRATSESFADYVEDVSTARALRVESVLTRQYQRHQSWAGVESIIQLVADLSGQRVVLADTSGVVVADSQNRLVGQHAQPSWTGEPVIITYQEKPVGSVYLDPLRPSKRMDNRGQTFLSVANQYLLWAVGVGLLAALILSLLLSRWLAAPLEAVTVAARRMARGDLSQRIEVRIGGEVGALAQAFNSTAASLSRLEKLRQQMVADIAHELRTPLTNIRGYLEAIQDGVAEPDAETLGILEHELGQLTRLVDDLQELALVEAGQLALSRQELDLDDLVERELRTLRPQADAQGVELRAERGHLPLLWADAGRLGQALRNILRNALAHTPRGGLVTVRTSREDDHAILQVRDTGSGIAPEDLPHVFERFYRGDKSRARQGQGGHGLGLTICRELVQAHGGEVGVTSTLGEGTEFTIRLPLVSKPAAKPVEAPEQRPRTPVRPAGRLELLRAGILVGGLFGATAGLIETGLLALGLRKAQSFADLFGYAVLLDAALFGLLGGLASLGAVLLARATGRRFDLVRQITLWAPGGCLLVGAMAYLRWKQLYSRDDGVTSPQAIFAQVAIFGVAAWVALLAVGLLAPRRGSARRALVFGRRLAPVALAVLVGAASVGVVRDLGERGFGLGPPAAAASGESRAEPRSGGAAMTRTPNVLLVTIDSLRADHLGSADYAKAQTPTLDQLAAEGVRFTNAFANQPDGNAAHAALFSGTYPATNGVRQARVDTLPPELSTLAEAFARRDYATAGVFSWLSLEAAYSGLEHGFQVYADQTVNRPAYLSDPRVSALAATYERLKSTLALPAAFGGQPPPVDPVDGQYDSRADVTTDGAISWLRDYQSRGHGQPFFLWVNYFDPHAPYMPPPPFNQVEPDGCSDCLDGGPATIRKLEAGRGAELSPVQIDHLLQYYDGEIAFTDQQLGRLLETMQAMGLDRNTLIVVVGDHGESFGDHNTWLHGDSLHDAEVHVPLILRWPGSLPAGQAVDAVAQQVDIMPTILDLLDLPVPSTVEGRSLLPLISGEEAGDDRYAVTELHDRSQVSIVTQDWRLIKDTTDGSTALYRTMEDPDDLHDQSDAEPEVVAELESVLNQWREAHP